jgi:ABC-2 type transport system ATP-binding protein
MSDIVLELKDFSFSYPRSEYLYQNLNFTLNRGEVIGVLGKNGSGKSTLMDIITFNTHGHEGEIVYFNEPITEMSSKVKERVGYVSQDISLNMSLKVNEMLEFHSICYPKYSKELQEKYLKFFEVPTDETIKMLSTGQYVKLLISMFLASNLEVYIMDEVTAVLDPDSRKNFYDLILELSKEGKSFIIATNIESDFENKIERILTI